MGCWSKQQLEEDKMTCGWPWDSEYKASLEKTGRHQLREKKGVKSKLQHGQKVITQSQGWWCCLRGFIPGDQKFLHSTMAYGPPKLVLSNRILFFGI